MGETGENSRGMDRMAHLAAIIAEMQQRLQEQKEEICILRQQNQGPEGGAGGNGALPLPPPPLELDQTFQMYERFRHMKPENFEGSTDPIVAEDCLNSLQIILDFMNLNDQDKVPCAAFLLKKDARYWWETVMICRDVATIVKPGKISITNFPLL